MTKLLEKALHTVRQLPPDSQDEIARAMLTLAGGEGEPEEIDAAHLPALLEGLAQTKRREFATDAEVEAAFRRFDKRSFALPRERQTNSDLVARMSEAKCGEDWPGKPGYRYAHLGYACSSRSGPRRMAASSERGAILRGPASPGTSG